MRIPFAEFAIHVQVGRVIRSVFDQPAERDCFPGKESLTSLMLGPLSWRVFVSGLQRSQEEGLVGRMVARKRRSPSGESSRISPAYNAPKYLVILGC